MNAALWMRAANKPISYTFSYRRLHLCSAIRFLVHDSIRIYLFRISETTLPVWVSTIYGGRTGLAILFESKFFNASYKLTESGTVATVRMAQRRPNYPSNQSCLKFRHQK